MISAVEVPWAIRIGFKTLMYLRLVFSTSIPASLIMAQKGAELPSMAGSSAALTSTKALSTPRPAKAAIKCSIVPISTPSSFMMREFSMVSAILLLRALMAVSTLLTSVRRKTMPVSWGAGRMVTSTRRAEWRPIPLLVTEVETVV